MPAAGQRENFRLSAASSSGSLTREAWVRWRCWESRASPLAGQDRDVVLAYRWNPTTASPPNSRYLTPIVPPFQLV